MSDDKFPHRHDIRLWLARHADDEPVSIHVGRTGYGEMTAAELRAELAVPRAPVEALLAAGNLDGDTRG